MCSIIWRVVSLNGFSCRDVFFCLRVWFWAPNSGTCCASCVWPAWKVNCQSYVIWFGIFALRVKHMCESLCFKHNLNEKLVVCFFRIGRFICVCLAQKSRLKWVEKRIEYMLLLDLFKYDRIPDGTLCITKHYLKSVIHVFNSRTELWPTRVRHLCKAKKSRVLAFGLNLKVI